ncbi:Putative peptidyl-prolyl cis-trans isomerase Cbf2 precursor [Variovorax sp. PBS-H4]|uniref:peptidylprolyl isomerase n=1 Tax=Variovorax sp. PBS-H4 TaxID=434008 RepID=UPI0013188C79|nr:peptidylprolyl isomerase [Variovorax sp. PBS-H4]VTU36167.1 Putative peptidyl-prolyl cis-trans isomerase Cbf2 precursor [Variovorax sp. PBS-H4]
MMAAANGCGGGACQCGNAPGTVPETKAEAAPASVNGIALHPPGERPDEHTLRELAWTELLRQEAVRLALLPPLEVPRAPPLGDAEQDIVQRMLDSAIEIPAPSEAECRRYHEARRAHFAIGRRVRARHILFAVTQGIDVPKLAARAEQCLLELRHKAVAPARFAELARELSNCPSGADGGELGWIGPDDCADELTAELFHAETGRDAIGLHPRLLHSRYGFHVLEVLERDAGRPQSFEEVRQRIAVQLAQQSRAKALHQYMQLLAGAAAVEGLVLDGADSLLVQ